MRFRLPVLSLAYHIRKKCPLSKLKGLILKGLYNEKTFGAVDGARTRDHWRDRPVL